MRTGLAFALALAAAGTAYAADNDDPVGFIDTVAKVTGLDTAQSSAADKDADRILADSLDAAAKGKALPIGPERGQLLIKATQLQAQGLARALDAAKLRADAAYDQKCAGAAGGSPAAASPPASDGGGGTSAFLSGAVRGASTGATQNDPWAVCASVVQYLAGIRQEVDGLRQRANALVGARLLDQRNLIVGSRFVNANGVTDLRYRAPLTAGDVTQIFNAPYGSSTRFGGSTSVGGDGGWDFKALAESAQKTVAQFRFYQRALDAAVPAKNYFTTPKDRSLALLRPAVRDSYYKVEAAIWLAWHLYQEEAAIQLAIAETSVSEKFTAADGPFAKRVSDMLSEIHLDQTLSYDAMDLKSKRVKESTCREWVAARSGEMDEAVDKARKIVDRLYEVRRRLIADAMAWKTFGLNDGVGTGPDVGLDYRDEDFDRFMGEALTLDPIVFSSFNFEFGKPETGWTFFFPSTLSQTFEPWCDWAGFFTQDPEGIHWKINSTEEVAAYNARVLAGARQKFPEVESAVSSLWLRFPVDDKGRTSEAIVSGAAAGLGP